MVKRCFYCLGYHETSQCTTRLGDRIISEINDTKSTIERLGYQTLNLTQELGDKTLNLNNIINFKLGDIQDAIIELHDFLSWAHSSTMWRLENQIEVLTGIHDMTKNPRATEANELYRMAEDSFIRKRFDDALSLLEEAKRLNPLDYRVHITMGHANTRINDLHAALKCFIAARDYARSREYKRDSLLLMTRTMFCLGNFDDAYDAAQQAVELTPKYYPAKYDLALCLANKTETISDFERMKIFGLLGEAIRGDRTLFVRSAIDPNWRTAHINILLNKLLNEAKNKAKEMINRANIEVSDWYPSNISNTKLNKLGLNSLVKSERKYKSHSYFGYLDAYHLAQQAYQKARAINQNEKHDLLKEIQIIMRETQNIIDFYNPSTLIGNLVGKYNLGKEWAHVKEGLDEENAWVNKMHYEGGGSRSEYEGMLLSVKKTKENATTFENKLLRQEMTVRERLGTIRIERLQLFRRSNIVSMTQEDLKALLKFAKDEYEQDTDTPTYASLKRWIGHEIMNSKLTRRKLLDRSGGDARKMANSALKQAEISEKIIRLCEELIVASDDGRDKEAIKLQKRLDQLMKKQEK